MAENNTNDDKINGHIPRKEDFDYTGSGAQTPIYEKPTPMPPIKPAKPNDETSKRDD